MSSPGLYLDFAERTGGSRANTPTTGTPTNQRVSRPSLFERVPLTSQGQKKDDNCHGSNSLAKLPISRQRMAPGDLSDNSSLSGRRMFSMSDLHQEANVSSKVDDPFIQSSRLKLKSPPDLDDVCRPGSNRSKGLSRPTSASSPTSSTGVASPTSSPKAVLSKSPSSPSNLLSRRNKLKSDLGPLNTVSKQAGFTPKADQNVRRIQPLESGQKIYDLFYWDEVIQETGCGGKVVVCSVKEDGPASQQLGNLNSDPFSPAKYVMKIKSKAELRQLRCEAQFRKAHLKMLNLPEHMGILPLAWVLEDDFFYFVVMEEANGGSLLSSLLDEYPDGVMPERAVKRLMIEILSAVSHLHNQGILHKDIKVDNLVVHTNNEACSPGGRVKNIKIIDFDVSDPDWVPNSPSKKDGWGGTFRSSAPETFKGNYSQMTDLYSVGVILYLIMTGTNPYNDTCFDRVQYKEFATEEALLEVYEIMTTLHIDWSAPSWKAYPSCRAFCEWLLEFKPESRPQSAEEALKQSWLRK